LIKIICFAQLFDKPSRNSSHLNALKRRVKEHRLSSQLKATHAEPLTLKVTKTFYIIPCKFWDVMVYSLFCAIESHSFNLLGLCMGDIFCMAKLYTGGKLLGIQGNDRGE